MELHNGFIIATVFSLAVTCSGQFFNNKPWPTYSLENMPQTGFSCLDKILGGYYADAETQCQMFHVCVKVAGVGVQDFRFLCPNSTAFDQEAQICANWADVDCEAATLYYGSDNFDLYRIGSGSEKRAPYADEDEATFHLQRAESGDTRRSKQVVVDQSTFSERKSLLAGRQSNFIQTVSQEQPKTNAPQVYRYSTTTTTTTQAYQPPSTSTVPPTQQTTTTTPNYNNYNRYNQNNNNYEYSHVKSTTTQTHQQPETVITTYAPFKTNTTQQQTDFPRDAWSQQKTQSHDLQSQQKPQKQHLPSVNYNNNNNNNNNDEIFRGSQSQHFYNNKNNGKEDFDEDFVNLKTSTTKKPWTRNRGRGRGSVRANNANSIQADSSRRIPTTTAVPTTTTDIPFYDVPKKQNYNTNQVNRQDPAPTINTNPRTHEHQYSDFNFNKFPQTNYYNQQTQSPVSHITTDTFTTQKSQDNTYNAYSTAIKLQQQQQQAVEHYRKHPPSTTINPADGTTQITSTLRATYQRTNNSNQQQTTYPPANNYNNTNYNQNQQTTTIAPFIASTPTPFSLKQENYKQPQFDLYPQQQTLQTGHHHSRGQSRSYNSDRQQTLNRRNENYTPASAQKKFSTLVPKDQYDPTTFKPSTYKKPIDSIAVIKQQKTLAPRFNPDSIFNQPLIITTTTTSTTAAPAAQPQQQQQLNLDIDEHDGQYHPELYEKDFAIHKIKQKSNNKQRVSNGQTPQRTQQAQQYSPQPQQYSPQPQQYSPQPQKYYPQLQKYSPQPEQYSQKPTQVAPQLPAQNSQTSSEDEFLKTAHSQNIAASKNELQNQRARENYNKVNSSPQPPAAPQPTTPKHISKAPTIPPNAKTTKKPVVSDKDASYDYAYYDSANPHDFSEYDVIEEFERTARKHTNKARQ